MAFDRSHARVFAWLAGGSALAAAYHLAAFATQFAHAQVNAAAWRHLVFVGIDIALAVLLLWRPRWLIAPVAIVTAQASWSHGHGLWNAWHSARQVDWVSVAVFLYLPFLVAAAISNAFSPPDKRAGD